MMTMKSPTDTSVVTMQTSWAILRLVSPRGLDNVRALLTGKDKVLTPAWKIAREGNITWTMRSHANHRELINSEFLLAER
jgi:hypothetical protein